MVSYKGIHPTSYAYMEKNNPVDARPSDSDVVSMSSYTSKPVAEHYQMPSLNLLTLLFREPIAKTASKMDHILSTQANGILSVKDTKKVSICFNTRNELHHEARV